jgi:hypothetical protein
MVAGVGGEEVAKQADDVIESKADLVKLFGREKFEVAHDYVPPTPEVAPEVVSGNEPEADKADANDADASGKKAKK